jgi:transposase-like protein
MMDFPLTRLLSPQRCYDFLVPLFHPDGLHCPNGHPPEETYVHKRDRDPVLDYRCKTCGRCFNIFTGAVLQGTKYTVTQIVQLLRGIAQGISTAQLAREMSVDRKWLLVRRHQLQALAAQACDRHPLPDAVTEADEMYQNAGEKRAKAS